MTAAHGGPKHKIDPVRFRSLATGGGDGHAVAPFWATERSWRLTVLLTLLESCEAAPEVTGPPPSVTTAWELLSRAYESDPDAAEDVLAQPQVGLWAAHTLRRVERPAGPEPLWSDVGYLHGLAVACAVRAGLACELEVLVRHGTVVLPTVGAADLPGELSHAHAAYDGATLTLTGQSDTVRAVPGDPRWHEPVRVEVGADDKVLRLTLLDRDLYRDLRRPTPPAPLSPDEVGRWRQLLGDAWQLLLREQPARAAGIASSLRTLTPEPRRTRFRPQSASGSEAFGGTLLSEPDDATQLAVTLIHEGQHHKLGALLHMFTLVENDPAVRYYAPWRDDPRSLSGLLQGVYAFAGITDFWRIHRHHAESTEKQLAEFEFALWRRQAVGGARVLAGSGRLTDRGQQFVRVLEERLSSWSDEPVPAEIGALADDVALDHHAQWRAWCMPVDAELGTTLVEAFRCGDPVPSAVLSDDNRTVLTSPEVGLLDGRAVLVRHRLTGATDLAALKVAGSTASDVELVSGRPESARTAYLRDLERNPADAHAWVGLGLTLDRRTDDPAVRALLGRPELLVAMAAARPDPLAAARWLGRGLPEVQLGEPRPAGWRVA